MKFSIEPMKLYSNFTLLQKSIDQITNCQKLGYSWEMIPSILIAQHNEKYLCNFVRLEKSTNIFHQMIPLRTKNRFPTR